MDILQTGKTVGDWISLNITKKVLDWTTSSGLINSELSSKIISTLVLLIITFLVIKFLNSINQVIKWIIIILLALLIISVGISIFT